jgi:citrate lyase gamma subunit
MLVEGLLQRMEAALAGESLDGSKLGAVGLYGKRGARPGRLAVKENGAGAADAVLTARVRSSKSQVLSDEVNEQLARLATAAVRLAIHSEGDIDEIIHGRTPQAT